MLRPLCFARWDKRFYFSGQQGLASWFFCRRFAYYGPPRGRGGPLAEIRSAIGANQDSGELEVSRELFLRQRRAVPRRDRANHCARVVMAARKRDLVKFTETGAALFASASGPSIPSSTLPTLCVARPFDVGEGMER